ncbi:MAG TPA: xanthine dehydrogenase family protein molybdopterin-binding subunit [Thermomicrobiales bacterium]|nr:xanthine dehydrogenase family protein molybdopterin-binding subunit [Thermomicrobiales bacterium]
MATGTEAASRQVGRPLRRAADRALVTGNGRFVDDLLPPGTLHVVFVRSPFAHADIVSVDTSAAVAAPGVVAVVTGHDLSAWMKPTPIQDPAMLPNRPLTRHSIASDRVRFAGEAVAAVIAESTAVAHDAAELVDVEYHELPAVTTAEAAAMPNAPIIHDGWDSNIAYHMHAGDGDVDAALAAAQHVVRLRLVQPRVASMYIEPKAVLASFDPIAERLTVWASTQTPHGMRTQIAAALSMPEPHIRVVAPDVGGAFGTKGRHAPDYLFVAAASRKLRRPVTWSETRSEYFRIANQGRDQVQEIEAAVEADGTITGLKVKAWVNCGAHNASTHGQRTLIMSGGAYRIPNLTTDVYGVMTTTTPTGPYRGAGRPEASYMVERLIEEIARVTGIDSIALRRRNFIPPDEFPYRAATGVTYDSGDYGRALDVALSALDSGDTPGKLDDLRASGLLVGVGVAVFVEPSGGGWDSAEVRVSPSGGVTVLLGVSPHGQGTDVGIAQLVADELGLATDQIQIVASDTDVTPQGIGTFGSRSMAVGGSAAIGASRKVAAKMCRIAAAMLEVAPDDIELAEGGARVIGSPDQSLPFARVATAAHAMGHIPGAIEPGLNETSFFMSEGNQFPFGVHVAVVSIDPETGKATVERFIGVDDCGAVINPLMVEGQVHGGLAQGFGQALWEQVVFDDSGQLVTGSLMDYAVPHADQLPSFELDHTETPSPLTPHGAKGVGEAGTTGAPPAIVNAVLDALRPLGVHHIDMPLASEKIWRAIQTAHTATRS